MSYKITWNNRNWNAIKTVCLFIFIFISIHSSFAITKTFNAISGNWSNAGNWLPNGLPKVTDQVILPAGNTLHVDVAAFCASFTFGNNINANNTLQISGNNSLTVSGNIVFSDPFGSNTIQTLAVNAGTLTCTNINYSNTTNSSEDNLVTVSTGTINAEMIVFAGAFDENALVFTDAATLNIAGSIIGTQGTVNVNTYGSTVNYNGTGTQTILATSYYNLIISGEHNGFNVNLFNSTINIAGTFTNIATFTTGTIITTGSTINYNGNEAQTIIPFSYHSLTISGTRTNNNVTISDADEINIKGSFNPSATFTTGKYITTGSSINLNGASQNIPIFSYNNLSCSGSGTKTASGSLVVNGTLGIANGVILNMTAFALNGNLNSSTGTGTLQTQNTSNKPIPVGINWSFAIAYNGQNAQTIVHGNYSSLNISGARTINNITLSNLGVIGVSRTFIFTASFTTGALVSAGSTIDLTGTNQTIPSFNYHHLICSGTGTKTASNALIVNGNLTIQASVVLNMSTHILSGALDSIKGEGILITQAASTTPLPTNKTWACSINYGGTETQTIVAGNYFNLTISGMRGSNNISLTNNGTINIANNFNFTATFTDGALISNGNTLCLTGANQNIPAINYHHFICSGSGIKTALGAITINGTFTIQNNITVDLNTHALGGAITATSGNGILLTKSAIPSGKTWSFTVNYNAIGNQTIMAGNYSNLIISGARGIHNIVLDKTGIITVAGTFNPLATFTSGTYIIDGSTIHLNGGNQNIEPFTFHHLTCSGAGAKTLLGNITVNGVLNIVATQLNINDKTLTINGTLLGTPILEGSVKSNLIIGGTGPLGENIGFNQSNTNARSLLNLTINRISGSVTLGNPIELIGTLTVRNGTLASNGNLKLISTANNTASVAPITGSGVITGNVVVQRFIQASARRFRFMSSPISNGTLEDWRNEMFITGNNLPAPHQSTTVGGSLNWGFDATMGNQATVFSYDETAIGSLDIGYTEVKNASNSLNNVPLNVGKGYRVFVRGDRSNIGFLNGTNNIQNALTTDLIGTLNTGSINLPVSFTNSGNMDDDGWCLVGNPYASAYDWNAYWDAGNSGGNNGTFYTNINPTIYVFDPNSSSFKSYNAAASAGNISNGVIASGQAFFVKATGSSPQLTFREEFKTVVSPTFMFKASNADIDEFRMRLQFDDINYDDYIMKFISTATKKQDVYDIVKLRNSNFNIASYISDSISFALDSRPEVKQNDTLFLNVTGVNGKQRIIVQNIPPNKYFYLVDNMLNVMIPLSNNLEYPFQIQTSNANSFGKKRFYIVISSNATLPVKLNAFAVNLLNRNEAQLNWVTSLEINNSYFEIERSLDGENFEVVGRVKGNGSTSKTINYSYTDNIAEIKANVIYYRLNQYDFDGSNELSPIKAVNLSGVEEDNAGEKTVQLSPNPVVSKTRLNFNTKITAEVEVKIFSEMGLLVEVIRVNPLTNPSFELDLSALETGMYILEAIDSKNNKFSTKFFKQ